MRLFRYLGLTLAVMAPLLILATLGSIFISFGRNDAIVIALLIGFTSVFGYAWYRHEHYRTCSEIRLSDDGTCELETKRRLIGLHVNEIRSVQLSPESDDRDESYSVRYQGGKLAVNKEMAAFADFLTRLKTLNPAVDLSSFPADWPHADDTETSGTGVLRFVFPLIVIIMLAGIAWETLR